MVEVLRRQRHEEWENNADGCLVVCPDTVALLHVAFLLVGLFCDDDFGYARIGAWDLLLNPVSGCPYNRLPYLDIVDTVSPGPSTENVML